MQCIKGTGPEVCFDPHSMAHLLAEIAAFVLLACSAAAGAGAAATNDEKLLQRCKRVSITQAETGTMYNGIPLYMVTIINDCKCRVSDVHLACGWFASPKLVSPNSFRRLSYDDCLVNGGRSMKYGDTIVFSYANSFMYTLKFKSANFSRCR